MKNEKTLSRTRETFMAIGTSCDCRLGTIHKIMETRSIMSIMDKYFSLGNECGNVSIIRQLMKHQVDLIFWAIGLWMRQRNRQPSSMTYSSFWAISIWLEQQQLGYKYYSQFVKHQIDLVLWVIGLWIRQYNIQLLSTKYSFWAINLWIEQQRYKYHSQLLNFKHQLDLVLWAIGIWIKSCKGHSSSTAHHVEAAPRIYFMAIMFAFFFVTMVSWLAYRPNKKSTHQRRTSRASAIQANRQFLLDAMSMQQNVINTILFFDESPSRADLISMMMTLATKYERMGSVPRVDSRGECDWHRINDLRASVDKAVEFDSDYEKSRDDVHALLRAHAHIGTILSAQDEAGHPMPLWRVVILSPTAALIRIDHCICDGLSAVTLLREVGIHTLSKQPLALSDLSPILSAIEKAGDMRIALSPLKLLWPLSLWRAVSFLAQCLSLGKEPPNPLRPLPEDLGSPIPWKNYGTVYFPTMPLSLFKDMARAMGNGITINDILLLCLSIAFGRYIDALDGQGSRNYSNINSVKVLLPIGNALRPSQYGDYHEGLCNRMTPVIVPLNIPRQGEATPFSLENANKEIKAYMNRVKSSNTPLFMTCMNTILQAFLPIEKLKEAAKHSFEGVSCVYSNVAGPANSISTKPTGDLTESHSYKINKIQVVMPHPVSIFQILSYDSSLFFNITLDTRAAAEPWHLRTAFVDAVKSVADATKVSGKWKDELKCLETSKEWGGNGIVYKSCGDVKSLGVLKGKKYSPVPKAA